MRSATGTEAPSLDKVLRRIEATTRAWPGEPLDGLGCQRVVNRSGKGLPIFWVFNSTIEFPTFAAQFADGRPLVGMRSLNQIVPREDRDLTPVRDELAQHYAKSLLHAFGTAPCIVGGNCQAAEIAYHLILHLLAAGVDVRSFVTVDAEWQVPLPVPVRMLFGRNSGFNPYRTLPMDNLKLREQLWSVAFPSVETATIDGGHGEYFRPENIATLVNQICGAERQASGFCRQKGFKLRRRRYAAGTEVVTLLSTGRNETQREICLVPVIENGDAIPQVDLLGLERVPRSEWIDGLLQVRIPPAQCRNVQLVPCLKGFGPMIWPIRIAPKVSFVSSKLTLIDRMWRGYYRVLRLCCSRG